MQRHTSAGTSINARKLPVLYTKLAKAGVLDNGTGIDLGSGKYTDHLAAFVAAHNGTMRFYDPYNQPESVNYEALIHRDEYRFCLCSNVLNVLDDESAVRSTIRTAVELGNGTAYFTVYEGDGTGIGTETQGGKSWQRNEKLRQYASYCDGYNVTFKNGVMTVRKGR